MSLSARSRQKLREIAIKHDVPEVGLPCISMVKRIIEASNSLSKEDDDTLRTICKEMEVNYEIFKKPKRKEESKTKGKTEET